MPAAMGRFQNLVTTFGAHLADYDTLKPVAFVPIVWTMIAGGIVVFVVTGLGLVVVRREPEVEEVAVSYLKAA